MPTKVQKNFRLTQTCVTLLHRLAVRRGINDGDIIEQLVRDEAGRVDLNEFEFIVVPAKRAK